MERKIQGDPLMPEERKQRLLHQHGKKESTFLRLRRTKLGLDDFRTVKVIGKGAFGEVRACSQNTTLCYTQICALGTIGTKDGYGQDICYEDAQEGRNVEERSS